MRFYESGLPQDKLVEDAFNFSYANIMAGQKEMSKSFNQQMQAMHRHNMSALENDHRAGVVKDEEYKMRKNALEKMHEDRIKTGPVLIVQELNRLFKARRLAPAQEIVKNADKASPALISAILLMDCVRSPLDYSAVETKFGSSIAGFIAEVLHVESYPSERDVNLAKASPDSKRFYLALLITTVKDMGDQVQRVLQANPAQKVMLPPGQDEQIFNNARVIWGNDSKLDARFVEVFNKTSEITSSVFRIELNAAGAPELVKDVTGRKGPAPTAPKPPGGGNGGLGGDVF